MVDPIRRLIHIAGQIGAIKGYGSTQDVIDGPQWLFYRLVGTEFG